MCILSYLPPGIPADEKGLYNGGLNNPHGHGWAIVADNYQHIIVGKSMSLNKALDSFAEARQQNMRGPAMFHSRWATHGSRTVANVHPFKVRRSPLTVVGHNGVLRAAVWPNEGDDRSDSRIFADEVLMSQFKRLDRPTCQRALTDWIGPTNKLVILTVDPRLQSSAYIFNQSAGQWDTDTGVWHSNGDYKWYTARGYWRYGASGYETWPTVIGGKTKTSTKITDWPQEICQWCEWGEVDSRGYCLECWQCQGCAEHINACQCYLKDEVAELEKWEVEEMEAADIRAAVTDLRVNGYLSAEATVTSE